MISRLICANVNANANYNNTLQLQIHKQEQCNRLGEMDKCEIDDQIFDDKLRFLQLMRKVLLVKMKMKMLKQVLRKDFNSVRRVFQFKLTILSFSMCYFLSLILFFFISLLYTYQNDSSMKFRFFFKSNFKRKLK